MDKVVYEDGHGYSVHIARATEEMTCEGGEKIKPDDLYSYDEGSFGGVVLCRECALTDEGSDEVFDPGVWKKIRTALIEGFATV